MIDPICCELEWLRKSVVSEWDSLRTKRRNWYLFNERNVETYQYKWSGPALPGGRYCTWFAEYLHHHHSNALLTGTAPPRIPMLCIGNPLDPSWFWTAYWAWVQVCSKYRACVSKRVSMTFPLKLWSPNVVLDTSPLVHSTSAHQNNYYCKIWNLPFSRDQS